MNLKEHIKKFDESLGEPLEESPKPFSYTPTNEKLSTFAPIEELKREIQDKDQIIEDLKNESIKLKKQVSITEKEKSEISEELRKSKWLENKITLATKKVYDDKVKSIISENVDSKLIPVLTAVARRKQGNQQLNWGSWLKIPENRYLYEVNKDIAKGMFGETNNLIERRFENESVRGSGGPTTTEFASNYSLTFSGDKGGAAESLVTTDFNPDDYDLNLGFTVSYWIRPDEVGTNMFAFGRKHNNQQRFVFGVSQANKIHIGIGSNKLLGTWGNGLASHASGQTAAELFPDLFTTPHDSDSDLIPGTWMHFVVTYADRESTDEGSVARIVYLNGELIKTANINWSSTGGSTGGMYFGARNLTTVGYNYGMACGLDEIAIFGEEKDSVWVTNTYNGGTPTDLQNEGGLVGYWRFEEGSGTTVEDLSGNGNHGTFAPISGDTTALPTWSNDTP